MLHICLSHVQQRDGKNRILSIYVAYLWGGLLLRCTYIKKKLNIVTFFSIILYLMLSIYTIFQCETAHTYIVSVHVRLGLRMYSALIHPHLPHPLYKLFHIFFSFIYIYYERRRVFEKPTPHIQSISI